MSRPPETAPGNEIHCTAGANNSTKHHPLADSPPFVQMFFEATTDGHTSNSNR